MSDPILEETLRGLRAALEATPDNGPLWAQVARLSAHLGRRDDALEAGEKALGLIPEGPERRELAGWLSTLRPPPPAEPREEEGGQVLRLLDGGKARDDDPLGVPERARVTFDDVGGLEDVKQAVRMKIILPFQRPEVFSAYGKKRGGGILMFGPPGCGKTLLARATAGECGATFINVTIDRVLDMWFGESERKLAELFEMARDTAPSVMFFDEVEAIGASRQQLRFSAGRSLVNQLLAELDGVTGGNDRVLVVAATNAPWHVDGALLRPGRFDRVVFVPPPDEQARETILELALRDKPLGKVKPAALVKKTRGWSGADLVGLVERALEAPLADALRTGDIRPLEQADLLAALKQSRSTTEDWMASAKNYATFANTGGLYDELLEYLKRSR